MNSGNFLKKVKSNLTLAVFEFVNFLLRIIENYN